MIKSFKDSVAETIFNRGFVKKLDHKIQDRAYDKLLVLNAVTSLDDLRSPPSNRLELLKGKRKGQHSIRINDQWRICFKWKAGNAYDVEIVDYH